MDRTDEFQRLCQKALVDSKAQQSGGPKQHTAGETAQFSAAASDISKEVHIVSQRLQQLTQLVRQNNMFNDPTQQINELTACIKDDITNINLQLDNLQTYSNSRRSSYTSDQSANHSDMIVSQMKNNLMLTTKGFKDILQVRQENLKLQNSRKSRYGKPSATSLALPRPGGISTDDESQEIVPLINPQGQQLAVPDQSYVESRAEAVTNIESHIVELGQIFNRLSVMINEQGDMVQRIDDNVEDTVSNITSGQNELMRYFQNLSDNRMLALKVFAILFSFMIFFLVFLA